MAIVQYFMLEPRYLITSTLMLVFILMFCYLLWTRRKLYIASYQLPGPMALPLLGNAFNFVGFNSTGEEIFNHISKLLDKWGDTFRFWVGPKLFIIITKPEDLEIIYTNADCMQKDLLVMKGMRAALGDGLITSDVKVWRNHRKLINPTFNPKILNGFLGTFNKHAKKLSESLKVYNEKGEFDVFPSIFQTTVRLIYETSLGGDDSSFDSIYEKLAKYLAESMNICFHRMVKPWFYSDTIFNLSSYGRQFKKNMVYLTGISDTVIQRKRQKIHADAIKNNSKEIKNDDNDDDIKIPAKKVLIDHLLELHDNGIGFTDSELRDQINTFFTGGSDTVANAASSALLLLGSNPECQEQAYAEIYEIFGDSNRDITIEDISQLKYLDRVIKESLRLFPQLPILVRYLKKDVKFSSVVAPAGSSIIFTSFKTQRDPLIWSGPLKFDPDRFLPEEVKKRHPYSYAPFGGGPRGCIGYRYAMLAIKVILCTLLRTYKFKSNIEVEKFRLTVEIIMKSVEGHRLQIQLRNK